MLGAGGFIFSSETQGLQADQFLPRRISKESTQRNVQGQLFQTDGSLHDSRPCGEDRNGLHDPNLAGGRDPRHPLLERELQFDS